MSWQGAVVEGPSCCGVQGPNRTVAGALWSQTERAGLNSCGLPHTLNHITLSGETDTIIHSGWKTLYMCSGE